MKKLFLFFVLALLGNAAKAQRDYGNFFSALNGGIEFGAATLREPLMSGFIGYNKPKSYIKFKFSSVMQDTYEVNVDGQKTTVPGFSEAALMLGKKLNLNAGSRFEFGAGAAVTSDLKKYDQSNSDMVRDKIIQKNAAGLVAEIRYVFRFVDDVGVSISINGNVNNQKCFATAGLGFVFGSK